MAQLNDLLVLGKSSFSGAIKANSDHDLLAHTNEFNFASPKFSGDIYVNYRTASGQDGNVGSYRFCKGAGNGLANVYAATFYGALSGNASTATSFSSARTIALTGDVTGSASANGSSGWSISTTVGDNSHNHSYLSGWTDTRSAATTPNDYNGQFKVVGIKQKSLMDIDGSSYSSLIGFRGWTDSSGGNAHELAFTGNGNLYHRHGSTTAWNSWNRIPMCGTANTFSETNTFTNLVTFARSGTDVSGTSAAAPSIVIGSATGTHIALDDNEIMAKTSATTSGTLYLNVEGGTVETSSDGFKIGTTHIRSNNVSSYSSLRIYGGAVGGYEGIHFGAGKNGMTVMSIDGSHQGLYNEAAGKWIIYYPGSGGNMGVGTSSLTSGYAVTQGSTSMTGTLYMNNCGISGVNDLAFADPGSGEGITWTGGNGWSIYESPDDLSNAAGNLQFVHGSTRRLTINADGYVDINARLVVRGNGSSYNEGIRILPASNKWSNIFFSADTSLSDTHDGGWLIGRRGAAGTIGAVGDFTIEEQNSNGSNLTIHKDSNGATLQGMMRSTVGYQVQRSTGDGYGLGLYGTSAHNSYGIHMSYTSTYGKHGFVQSDWATYFCFDGATDRGWIFKQAGTNVASISGTGGAKFDNTVFGYAYTRSNNKAAFMWDKPGSNYTGVGANGTADTIYFGACTTDGSWVPSYKQHWIFNGSITSNGKTSVGSYQAGATTVPNLVEEVRYSNGCMGSVSIGTAYPASAGGTIATGWYNFVYVPHRSGGLNGAASGDNCNYGTLMLYGMTVDSAHWRIRVSGGSIVESRRVWNAGDSVTGAVWNDYAECRESDCEDFGYVLCEKGDDTLTKTTERLSHFAGISSDTWGFSQGKTKRATTPIAVAGRVLVYPYQNRNNYKPGDCVCAAPGGTVDIMTREEIIQYPDRIVGTVSCVPEYDTWGGGEGADRPAVAVNGRIWIKVK